LRPFPRFAARIVSDTTVEAAGFFVVEDVPVFGYAHLPRRKARGAVLICPPVLAEAMVTGRRDRLLAERLAESGWAVLRFHYRGSGHSGGMAEDCTLESLAEDATAASHVLSEMSGSAVDTIIGTRIGGTAAAMAARTSGIPALGLVAPVFDTSTYFREIFRSHMMSELKSGLTGVSTGIECTLQQGGCADVLGYPFGGGLYRSIDATGLEPLLRRPLHSLLMIQMAGGTSGHAIDGVADRLSGDGVKVQVRRCPSDLAWWFGGGSFRRRADETVNAATTQLIRDWVEDERQQDR
jgi:pimeloyl-ACP methyl ester carboxylesterase